MTPAKQPYGQEKPKKSGLVLAVLIGVAFCALIVARPLLKNMQAHDLQGAPAPAVQLTHVQGAELFSLADVRGKVVVLDFWTTWCPPCQKSMPHLQALHYDPVYKDKLVVVAVNANEAEGSRLGKVLRFVRHFKMTMPTVWADAASMSAYQIRAFPTMVVIAPDGTISSYSTGGHDLEDMRRLVDEALAPPS